MLNLYNYLVDINVSNISTHSQCVLMSATGDSSIETIDGRASPASEKPQEVALRPQELCRLQRNSSFNAALNNDRSLSKNPELNSRFTSSWAAHNPYFGLPDSSSSDCRLRHNQVDPLPNGLYYVPPPTCELPPESQFLDAQCPCTNNAAQSPCVTSNHGVKPHIPSKQRKEVRFAEMPTYQAESVEDGDLVAADSYIMDAVDADLTKGIELDMLGGGDVMTV